MYPELNLRAARLASEAIADAARLRIEVSKYEAATLLDFGVNVPGGIAAGLLLARICMADLADICLVPGTDFPQVPHVQVQTDHPVDACLRSQYAGWKIATDDYFAMGSGPMRILARVEDLQKELGEEESKTACVGVLESGSEPSAAAIEFIRRAVGNVQELHLLTAPTASISGTIQVVARSVETALHKLHDLNFPLDSITSGCGIAPLPPVARNDLEGIGRTNDAILYGGTVNLWVDCDDDLIETIGPNVPSSASASHGRRFLDLFREADHDFYKLDPKLFSPAEVIFHNARSGRSISFGRKVRDVLEESFGFTPAESSGA